MRIAGLLDVDEINFVIDTLRARRRDAADLQLVIVRLSACCGLRVSEIRQLLIGDIHANGDRPFIRVRRETVKGKTRTRDVPLWWDSGTRDDILHWLELREMQSRWDPTSPFVASQRPATLNRGLAKRTIQLHWKRAIKRALGADRAEQSSIHCGRHSYASNLFRAGASLATIRDVLGHSSITITDIYVHAQDFDNLKDVFGRQSNEPRSCQPVWNPDRNSAQARPVRAGEDGFTRRGGSV
jgi:site-specific recombinase XerC